MAEPKIIKNVHIQQWNGDENYWSTQKPLMEGEIGIVNKTNSKTVATLVVGDGSTNIENLLLNDSAFYPGIGAGYILPTASSTVHGGLKISDNYFYIDQGVLKPKTLQLIEDDNPDNPDEFNKANKSGNDAFISSPATDWKLQGDFYAETLYADEARIKNIVYEQETNIEYSGKHIDIHKNAIEYELTEFSVQLSSEHYSEEFGGYVWHLSQLYGPIQMPSQDITVSNLQSITREAYFQADNCNFSPLSGGGYKITGSVDIGEYVFLGVRNISIRYNRNWIYLTNIHTYVDGTIIVFDGEVASLPITSFEVGQIFYNSAQTTTSTITLPAIDDLSVEQSFKVDDYSFSFSLYGNMITLLVQGFDPNSTNTSIVFYDNIQSTPVLQDDERAGIKIYNYHKNDQSISKDKRKIAELSIDNQGILAYASDNSDLTNFSDVLTVNRYLANIDGFVWLSSTPTQPVSLTYYNKIPIDKVDLTALSKLNMFLNQNNIGTYDPSNATEQSIAINACSGIVANGTTYSVQEDGLITLADSTWTNELNSLLHSAVQKITFDGTDFEGQTLTLNSKIQSIKMDDQLYQPDENGIITLSSKIQKIVYNGINHTGPIVTLQSPKVSSLQTTKGTGADQKQYTTIIVNEDPSTNTYSLKHYDTDTINEPVGTETNVIGESGSKTSFNLMSNLSYDHYGHAEKYSSYTLDFSALISRIQQLETKVAELEEQLKAS